MPRRKDPRIPDAVLDQLLAGADPKTVFDPNGLLDDLKKALAERALNAKMDHLFAGEEPGNRRNGYGKKTVITEPARSSWRFADREARFDPQLIARYQRRFPGFDDKIISMCARGMSTREIVGHLRDLYGIDISPDDQRGHRRGSGGSRILRGCTSRSACVPTAPRKFSACGSSKMRAPNVHLLRHRLDFVSWTDRKPVAAALKEMYRAVDVDAGE